MSPPCSSSWSWGLLCFLLALNSHHAWSAPDFSDFLHTVLKNHTAHACEGETLSIRCPSKTSVVILSAFYGRHIPSQYLCPDAFANGTEENTECTSTIAAQKVASECQDRRACQIPVASPVFGQDPCPETSKYILVYYKCRPAHHRLRTACENEKLRLACRNNTVLAIYSATFGHLEHDTAGCPQGTHDVKPDMGPGEKNNSVPSSERMLYYCGARAILNLFIANCKRTEPLQLFILCGCVFLSECLSSTALRRVSRKCHGRTNCTVLASVQNFGDPCFPGTSKHLRVSFTCVPRYLLEDVAHGGADPFRISDYTHGLPETVALYFVSGICAGLVFLLCLFGVKSTLVRDVKDLWSDLEDEIKTARRSRGGLINDDTISLDSSFPHITHPYRGADFFSPEMVMTVVMEDKRDEDRDKAEMPNGDIWPHCNSSPYAIHKTQLSSA